MMLKALPLVHFWSVLLLKEQMMTSVTNTLITLVWADRHLTKFSLKNNHKIGLFYRLIFGEVWPKHSRESAAKSADFSTNLPLKIPGNLTFFRYLSEAQHSMVRSIRFENWISWSRYKFAGKVALFMRFGTFFMMKAKQDKMKYLF